MQSLCLLHHVTLKLRGVQGIERKILSGDLIVHDSPIRNVSCCFLPSERSTVHHVASCNVRHTQSVDAVNIPGQTSVQLLLL